MNELIEETLKNLNIPCKHITYNGKERPYITYFEANNYDEDYTDDEAETNTHSLQIDLWSKKDERDLINKIKKALKEVFYDVTYQELYEDATEIYHTAFRCYFYEEKE